ncbi:uncharacterized protein LOC129580883 isoform X3 [Paramacrobiotus metropolitanus]|nr:uncharacterized protein LOC129580883 isoform X3 [Paramacrobiotus metropolitanus]XP_055327596.1 uncharacterized protein LOC129580883 isoform X3 [Paramacrobiotus metropolitanus]XP_055327597.1 uncharacterized protein LOC129580883 isoform X3 [Paramacrobiotus metropolitanus]XP_055327598.1 uncharacterized protein LOC129580883 isoform X3 [Paramacrobiotus metropolitanus]XP_055327599.1 uncharacterized protein LOC129580883 isoform X3 [Paramacrobiotus metropolitanus]
MTTAPRIKWARKAISILRKRKSTTVYVAKPKCRVNRGSARMVATLGPTLPDPIAPPRLCRVRYSALYVTARAPQNEIQQQGDQSGDKWYRLLQVIKERRLKTCITFDATGFSRESRFIRVNGNCRTTGFQIVRPTDRMDGFYYDVPNRARKSPTQQWKDADALIALTTPIDVTADTHIHDRNPGRADLQLGRPTGLRVYSSRADTPLPRAQPLPPRAIPPQYWPPGTFSDDTGLLVNAAAGGSQPSSSSGQRSDIILTAVPTHLNQFCMVAYRPLRRVSRFSQQWQSGQRSRLRRSILDCGHTILHRHTTIHIMDIHYGYTVSCVWPFEPAAAGLEPMAIPTTVDVCARTIWISTALWRLWSIRPTAV